MQHIPTQAPNSARLILNEPAALPLRLANQPRNEVDLVIPDEEGGTRLDRQRGICPPARREFTSAAHESFSAAPSTVAAKFRFLRLAACDQEIPRRPSVLFAHRSRAPPLWRLVFLLDRGIFDFISFKSSFHIRPLLKEQSMLLSLAASSC